MFAIASTPQNPPAAAARVPVSTSSTSSRPGVRRWTCGSKKAGKDAEALGVDLLRPVELGRPGLGELGDLAAANDDVTQLVDPGPRIEHPGPAKHEVLAGLLAGASPVERGDRTTHAGSPIGVGAGSSASGWAPRSRGSPPASSS